MVETDQVRGRLAKSDRPVEVKASDSRRSRVGRTKRYVLVLLAAAALVGLVPKPALAHHNIWVTDVYAGCDAGIPGYTRSVVNGGATMRTPVSETYRVIVDLEYWQNGAPHLYARVGDSWFTGYQTFTSGYQVADGIQYWRMVYWVFNGGSWKYHVSNWCPMW